MARQQIERLDFEDPSRITYFGRDQETGSCSDAGVYFKFCESCRHMAAAITRTVAEAIRSSHHLFGSYTTATSFTLADLRFAWIGVMAGIAGLAALLLFGWSEIGAGTVSATERRADPSRLAAIPWVETQAERMEAIRRRGLELLRADIPEDEPPQSSARGDRLELHGTIKPVVRIATAGEDDDKVAAPAPLPTQPAAGKPAKAKAKAKEKQAVKERRASRYSRNRVAHARNVQVAPEPQMTSAGGLQANRVPPEENKAFGWVPGLPDTIVPSSWKSDWENLWAKGNGGGGSSCSPSANPAAGCPREVHARPR
jgi:hypothetical protein